MRVRVRVGCRISLYGHILFTDVAFPGHCASLEGELADARSAGAEVSAQRDYLRDSLAEAEERPRELEHELVELQCAIPKPFPIT